MLWDGPAGHVPEVGPHSLIDWSFLGSSFKRTWSHDRICTKLVCNQDLYVKMERDLCGLLYPDTNNLHPFIAGNLTWTSVPAPDATYGPCMSVA